MIQKQMVIESLTAGVSLTQRQAYRMGIGRLSARVWELRRNGWNIKMKLKKVRKGNRDYAWVAEYSL